MKLSSLFTGTALCITALSGLQCGKSSAAADVAPAPADALFEQLGAGTTGIDFENLVEETHQNNVLTNSYLYNGGGVGVIDFNNDGLQDLYFTRTQGSCKLFQNLGNLKFRDVTDQAGVQAMEGEKSGVAIADVNADGWADIYVCRTGMQPNDVRRNLLFINNKNGSFTEQGRAYGLADGSASNQANFFDADGDGDLDCYVLNYPVDFKSVNSARVQDVGGGVLARLTTPENQYDSDHLYQNNGNGTFTDISKKAGINNRAFGLSVTTTDINNDGYQDIIVGNDYIEPDFVYVNNSAQPGNFTDRCAEYFRHSSNHTMGVDIADINNDGYQDLIALDMLAEDHARQRQLMTTMLLDRYTTLAKYGYGNQQMRNVLQLNNGRGSFSEIGCLAGVFQTDWSWAPLLQDFDNDGYRDLFITNGYRRDVSNLDYLNFTADSIQRTGGVTTKRFQKIEDYLDLIPSTPLQKYCYRNRGDLTFENVSTAWGFVQRSYSNGSAYADLDNDGDMDLILNNLASPSVIYRNRAVEQGKSGGWLQLKLTGSAQNPGAFGARARVQAGGQTYYADLTPIRGFLSSVEPIFHFGLGTAQTADRVEIEFPGGQLVVLENVAANKRYTVQHAEGKPGRLTPPATPPTPLREGTAPAFVHREDDVQDFNRERLLPWKMSNPGPSMAAGDVNGDGLDDFYVGNAPGAAGALLIQQANATFQPTSTATWQADQGYEDTGAVLFDADGDGDLDLFVASGGNTFNADDPKYQPRLYRNDGRGNFSATTGTLPVITASSSACSAFDYDRDGDLDLVLGGWCTPLAYPAAPNSYVLRNDQGKFQDVTGAVAPQLQRIGMVRALAWADLDGDQQEELVVTGEWMPLAVFSLQNGKLTLATERFGLQGTEGFWRSVTAVDLDKDGDLDLVAGNLGENTRYKASPEAPLRLFASDFDKNGSMDPIMTESENGQDRPVAFRDVMFKQLPVLKKKFVRYTPYAAGSLSDFFSDKDLEFAQRLQANHLASAVFINQGGRFTMQKLPTAAQVAPVYAIRVLDWQNDGSPDLLLVGNDYGQQVETGRIDAGNGLLLENDGRGNLKPIPAMASGFWATREARDVQVLRSAGGKKTIVVANNNDKLQVFQLQAAAKIQ